MNTAFLFRVWPYVALATLVAGFVFRCVWWLFQRPAVSEASSKRPREAAPRFEMWAWTLLVLLHAAPIVAPSAIIASNASPIRLYVLEGASFFVGLAVLASWVLTSWRHFARPWSLADGVFDSAFLGLVLMGIGSGIALAVFHRWASTWGAAILTPYLISLVRGAPRAAYVEQMPLLVRVHVFAAFAAVAVAPFTSFLPSVLRRFERAARSAAIVVRPVAWARGLPRKTAALEADVAAADAETPIEQG